MRWWMKFMSMEDLSITFTAISTIFITGFFIKASKIITVAMCLPMCVFKGGSKDDEWVKLMHIYILQSWFFLNRLHVSVKECKKKNDWMMNPYSTWWQMHNKYCVCFFFASTQHTQHVSLSLKGGWAGWSMRLLNYWFIISCIGYCNFNPF